MDSPETPSDPMPGNHCDLAERPVPTHERVADERDQSWLVDIVDRLESDPEECWHAVESLMSVEADLRLSIIDAMAALGARSGAQTLLRLLSEADDPATRAAARSTLARVEDEAIAPRQPGTPTECTESPRPDRVRELGVAAHPYAVSTLPQGQIPQLARCLVTPVDGQGRGTIVISVSRMDQRRTAAFLCDVRLGIRDVVGQDEPESPSAGGLVDALDQLPESGCARDVPELALGLLAGSLLLCGADVPEPVRGWLLGTLGPEFRPAGFPATIPGMDHASIPQTEMPDRAALVLEACPSWLDLSPLTFELAEEIWLREGRTAADPDRDAGAYRFLFEHRLIDRLELYRRMLLWMACVWKFTGEIELSRSALALAWQLADEQYAVPSHPFAVALTTRSLEAAQERLRSAADPRD